jgi:hypothetical protein
MRGHSKRENREISSIPWRLRQGRSVNLSEGTTDMYIDEKSDDSVLPAKRANKSRTLVAEFVEGRESPKRSNASRLSLRTPGRIKWLRCWPYIRGA